MHFFLIQFKLNNLNLFIFRQIKSNKPDKIESIENEHFIFLGYKKKFIYWECLIIFWKIVLICYVSRVDSDGNSIVVSILILNISHLLHVYYKPYKKNSLNTMENISYFIMTSNFYFLLFFYITHIRWFFFSLSLHDPWLIVVIFLNRTFFLLCWTITTYFFFFFFFFFVGINK